MSKIGAATTAVSALVVAWWAMFGNLGESDDVVAAPVPMPLQVSPAPTSTAPPERFSELEPSFFPAAEPEGADRFLSLGSLAGMDHQGLPRAWTVLVGEFADAAAAEALLARLLADRYSAYRYVEEGPEGVRHVVAVGPKIDRRRALDVKRRLGANYRIEASIRPYDPLK